MYIYRIISMFYIEELTFLILQLKVDVHDKYPKLQLGISIHKHGDLSPILKRSPLTERQENVVPFDSFNHYTPKKQKKYNLVNYKFKSSPVRGKAARALLTGYQCKDCEGYYSALSPGRRTRLIQKCSKHRALHPPVVTSSPQEPWKMEITPDPEKESTQYGPLSPHLRRGWGKLYKPAEKKMRL